MKIITIGCIGHEDIEDLPEYRDSLRKAFAKILSQHPDGEIRLVSRLATGGDQIAVRTGRSLGLKYDALLPMPLGLYVDDYPAEAALEEFRESLSEAADVRTIGYFADITESQVKNDLVSRRFQYASCGYKLARQCDYMIAFFDENKTIMKLGGVADIVRYRELQNKPLIHIPCHRHGFSNSNESNRASATFDYLNQTE